jgi:hypothetical protein
VVKSSNVVFDNLSDLRRWFRELPLPQRQDRILHVLSLKSSMQHERLKGNLLPRWRKISPKLLWNLLESNVI